MIHRKILEQEGCTAARLREIFTSTDSESPNGRIKKKFEDQIMAQFQSGFATCAKHAKIFQAVDIAMDSTPINDETIPLLLWAQGKIKQDKLIAQIKDTQVGAECLKKEKDKDGRETIKVDIPRLYEVSVNLIRAYISRRLATQSARFSNLWPYFVYEPRGTDEVSKLRGDCVSQRIDAMADAYNYRHFFPQTFRHQFMYARSVVFPRSAWDCTLGWRAKDNNVEGEKIELESYVQREGVDFCAPHPSRIYRDTSAPLPNINTDNGPRYIGYWDIVPWRTIKGGEYFNTDHVTFGETTNELLQKYAPYFSYYFDAKVLEWPSLQGDPTAKNDRTRELGRYSVSDDDKGCLIAQHFVKINPKHEGIGKLNMDVWMRLILAGDNTVIGGEFLTSLPACYGGLNENDDRLVNPSLATELMPYQDQLSNLFSQMIMTIKTGMLQIWAVDQDALDADMKDYVKKTLASQEVYTEPKAFFYSGSKMQELGLQSPGQNPRAFLSIIQAQVLTDLNTIYQAIGQCLAMADKMVMMSPNEQAQPNPREVAAREVTEISSSTNAIQTFVSDGIDEQRAAVKRLCYESLVCETTQSFKVPVINRYTAATIKAAGFQLSPADLADDQIVPMKTPIVGTAKSLIYDYYFDSRDGADRAVHSQGAQILSQFFGQMSQSEVLMNALGKRRIFEILNEIIRLSGAAYDLKLDDNESEDMNAGTDLAKRVDALQQELQALIAKLSGQPPAPPAGGPAPAPDSAPAPAGPAAPDEGSAPAELPAALQT